MSDSIITKKALAQALKELMQSRPITKISVSDICERCGLNRKSFYYHFKDKYDLINWIYSTEFFDRLSEEEVDLSNGWKSLELLCEYFAENKTFYQNALTVQGQNSFFEYFGDMLKTVSAANLDALLDDGQHHDFYITFFSDAFRSVIMRWLIEGAQIPPSEFVRLLKNAITGFAYKVTCEVDSRESD